MGGLKPEIVEDIRMLKPKSLKEEISLARMRDDQLTHQGIDTRSLQLNHRQLDLASPTRAKPAVVIRAQGLCFNCDDKFTPGHKCRGPQVLLLEVEDSSNKEDKEDHVANEP